MSITEIATLVTSIIALYVALTTARNNNRKTNLDEVSQTNAILLAENTRVLKRMESLQSEIDQWIERGKLYKTQIDELQSTLVAQAAMRASDIRRYERTIDQMGETIRQQKTEIDDLISARLVT